MYNSEIVSSIGFVEEKDDMTLHRKPNLARLDQVRISREEDTAIIEYGDGSAAGTHFKIGPRLREMTDQEVLDLFNAGITAREQFAASYEHIALEIPPGRPQVSYFALGGYWVPRRDVLRCIVHDGGPEGDASIEIGNHEYTLQELLRC